MKRIASFKGCMISHTPGRLPDYRIPFFDSYDQVDAETLFGNVRLFMDGPSPSQVTRVANLIYESMFSHEAARWSRELWSPLEKN